MARVMIFIDGSNIWWSQNYFSKNQGKKFRIDFRKLIDYLIDKRELIRSIYYGSTPDKISPGQANFIEYLRKLSIQVIEKKLKIRTDPTSGKDIKIEKGVDVALAVDLLAYAWENAYDVAILVAGDEDYVGAVEKVMSKGKNVELVSFKGSTSRELRQHCGKTTFIDDIAKIVESKT